MAEALQSEDAQQVLEDFACSYGRLPGALRVLRSGGVTLEELAASTGLPADLLNALLTPQTVRQQLHVLSRLAEMLLLEFGTLPERTDVREIPRDEARLAVVMVLVAGVRPQAAGGAGPVPSRARPRPAFRPDSASGAELAEMLEDYLARAAKYLRDIAHGHSRTAHVLGELTALRYVLDYVYPHIDVV